MSLRPFTAFALALLVTLPSVGSPPTYSATLRSELEIIQELALEVRDPELRRAIYSHARYAADALEEAERRGWRDRDTPTHLTYAEALTIVQRETFDSGKVEAIRRVARTGRFTTEEARSLAAQCTFDSAKIDALVALYPAVTDPARFDLALDVLTFTSSRAAVAERVGL